MKIKWLPFLLIAFLFNGLTAEAQTWLWGEQSTNTYYVESSSNNVATNVTGNVYQTGTFYDPVTFGTITLSSSAYSEVYLVKYDHNGNVVWAIQSKTLSGQTFAGSVATDDSDNVYITGASGVDAIFGVDTLKGPGFYLVKYDRNGNLLWAKQQQGNSGGVCISIDHFGHEYVTGYGPFLIKYDKNGNIIWSVPFNSFGFDVGGISVTTDIFGNVYMAGYYGDSLLIESDKLKTKDFYDIYIAKFDSSGNLLWANQSTNAYAGGGIVDYSVAADDAGAVYLTGSFGGTINFGSNAFASVNDNSFNFFVVKYKPIGTIAWAKEPKPLGSTSWGAWSICVDDSNRLYISGGGGLTGLPSSFIFASDTFNITGTTFDPPSFLFKIDTSGYVICGSTLEAGGEPNAVASDNSGKFVYLSGAFYTSFSFGNDSLIEQSSVINSYVGRWEPCNDCYITLNSNSQSPIICSGQNINLTAIGATNYNWSPSIGLSSTSGSSVVADPIVTTTYNIFATSAGCSDSEQIVITVNPTPDVQVSPTSLIVCPNQNINLLANGANTYQWFPSTGLNTTTGDSVIANPSVNTTYTIIGTNGFCKDTTQSVITINLAPNQPTITVKGDTLISSAIHYNQWFRNDSLLAGDTSQFLIIGKNKGYYFVEVTNPANGCSTTSDSTTSVNQLSLISEQLSIYPNPFNNSVVVKISSAAININQWNLQITDVLGRTVYTQASLNYTNEINLSNLPAAMYFITVTNNTGRAVVPVVKGNN